MPDLLIVENDGPKIVSTNYWSLPPARGERLMVSLNAGTFRVLLRPEAERDLPDMEAARECLVSRGPWPAMGLKDGIEILFEDDTDSPYALHLQVESLDRVPLDSDAGLQRTLSVWTQPPAGSQIPVERFTRPCWYRRVQSIPCLKPREAR